MTNKFVLAALSATMFIPAAAQAQRLQPATVAVVDTDRIARDCTACRSAAAQLQSQEATLRTRAQALQTSLQTARTPIEQSVAALNGKQPDAALQARITAYQTQERNAQQELQSGQQRLQSTQANVNQQIGARLSTIVGTVAAARGASIAVSKDATLFAAANVDVTAEVLAQLNTQLPAVSVTPLPQAARPQGR